MTDRRPSQSPRRRTATGVAVLAWALVLAAAAPFGVPCRLLGWCGEDSPVARVVDELASPSASSCCEMEARESARARDLDGELTPTASTSRECATVPHPHAEVVFPPMRDESYSVSRLTGPGVLAASTDATAIAPRNGDSSPPGAFARPGGAAPIGITRPLSS